MGSKSHGRTGRLRAGYSLVELVIVMSVAAILLGMAGPQFSEVRDRQTVINARDAVRALTAQARSLSIERGQTVKLTFDPALDRAELVLASTSALLDSFDFSDEFATDLQTESSGIITICYTPRGYASQECSGTVLPQQLTLSRSDESAAVRIAALGTVERL